MGTFGCWRDLQFACRTLVRQRSASLMSVGILALGIAGMVTVFSLFNGLYLRPFPVPNPDRLMDLDETAPKWNLEYTGIAYPDFHAWREHNQSFEAMCAWTPEGANLSLDGRAERIKVLMATHEYFDVLSIRPMLGRRFTQEEDRPNGPKVVLLSHGLWQQMSGRSPAVLGQTLQLDGTPYTIVGVLPPEAGFPVDIDLLRPLAADPQRGTGWYLSGIGRLKKGVTAEQARADLTRIHRGLIGQRAANQDTSPTVKTLRQRYLGEYWQGITVLLGAVGLVLLIACCNVASIMLARGVHRGREIATRLALGATSRHIVRHMLAESVLLSLAGGIIGVLAAHAVLDLLTTQFRTLLNMPRWMTFGMDIRCVFFCLLTVGAATILSGLVPGLHAARTQKFYGVLQSSGIRNAGAGAGRRTLSAIVVGQVALALTLLICTGLVWRAFCKVREIDPGFRPAGVLTYQISLTSGAYTDEARRRTFFAQHLECVRTLPGVIGAGLINTLPMSGTHQGNSFEAEGAPPRGPNEENPIVLSCVTVPGYFETMGIKVLSGRLFGAPENRPDSERTAIVNESFARYWWPGQNPIDKRIRFAGAPDWMRVVGVTGDVKHYGLEQPVRPSVYISYERAAPTTMFAIVRTRGDPVALVSRIREFVRAADADLPIHDVKTMADRVRASMLFRLTYSSMFVVFGTIAALMAFAGIYGVTSYWAGQRTQEIGIRMALGARATDVVRMVIRQGLRLVGLGLILGLLTALGLSRLLAGMLYHVSPTDLLTFVAATFALMAATAVACYLPARRAARIDPMVALRYE